MRTDREELELWTGGKKRKKVCLSSLCGFVCPIQLLYIANEKQYLSVSQVVYRGHSSSFQAQLDPHAA